MKAVAKNLLSYLNLRNNILYSKYISFVYLIKYLFNYFNMYIHFKLNINLKL